MILIDDKLWTCIATVFYASATLYSIVLWRKGFLNYSWAHYILVGSGVGSHSLAIALRGFRFDRCPVHNLYESTLFIAWTIGAFYLAMSRRPRLRPLGIFVSPLLMVITALALLLDLQHSNVYFSSNSLVSLHAVLILLAYAAYGLSFVAGLAFLMQQHGLKWRKGQAVFSIIPPLQRLRSLTTVNQTVGTILLASGLLISPLLAQSLQSIAWYRDSKVLWSILVLLMFMFLIVWRKQFNPSSTKIAFGAVMSFVVLIVTFWCTNLMSNIHYTRF